MAKKKKKTSKKNNYAISKTNKTLIAKSEALKKITEHIRDYLTLTLTIPLGNTALKKVHTNQWLFTNLPKEFDLANWTIIADALNSNQNRFGKTVKNKWYIESCDTTVEVGGKAEMKLKLNPFASSLNSYSEAVRSMQKAYTDAKAKKNNNNNKTNKNKNKNKTNAIVNGKNTSLRGGEGKFINDLVKKVCGNETDPLEKAKLIHEHIRKRQHYSYYTDSHHWSAKSCYENITHLNCADMSRLTRAMMASAGINCYVVHATCHYYTVLKINGKLYCSDNASSNSTGREFNKYWKGSSCRDPGATVWFKGKSSYYAVCGKNPCS